MAKHSDPPVEASDADAGVHPCVESGADIDNWTIGAIALTSAFVVTAIIFFVQALDNTMATKERSEKAPSGVEQLEYESDQEEYLSGYRWVDQKEDLVAIPIDEAKKLLAQEGIEPVDGETPTPEPPAPAPTKKQEEEDEEKDAEDEGAEDEEEEAEPAAPKTPTPRTTPGPRPPAPAPAQPAPAPAPPAPAPAPPAAPSDPYE